MEKIGGKGKGGRVRERIWRREKIGGKGKRGRVREMVMLRVRI